MVSHRYLVIKRRWLVSHGDVLNQDERDGNSWRSSNQEERVGISWTSSK
jgi:hypothetical protein